MTQDSQTNDLPERVRKVEDRQLDLSTRVAHVETRIDYTATKADIEAVRTDLQAFRAETQEFRADIYASLHRQTLAIVALQVTQFVALAGAMAKGFGWI